MLNYNEFKSRVEKEFLSYMSDEYQHMELKFSSVDKVNRRMDGITLVNPEEVNGISPAIYINHMYEDYLKTEEYDDVLTRAARMMERAYEERNHVNPLKVDFSAAKENIVFQLVNTMQNQEMLEGIPHREFQDLSIVYRWIVKKEEEGIQSAIIKNQLAENFGLNEENLFQLAKENTRRILPPVIKNMNEVIYGLMLKEGMEEAEVEIMMKDLAEQPMWVITNEMGINGAASMLYEDKLHELSEKLGQDLYVMPSSIHEVIAVPASIGSPYMLAEMVTEINMSQVQINERLSNQVYHYDKDLRTLTLATDTINKSLEMEEAEEYQPNLFRFDMENEVEYSTLCHVMEYHGFQCIAEDEGEKTVWHQEGWAEDTNITFNSHKELCGFMSMELGIGQEELEKLEYAENFISEWEKENGEKVGEQKKERIYSHAMDSLVEKEELETYANHVVMEKEEVYSEMSSDLTPIIEKNLDEIDVFGEEDLSLSM